MRVSRMLVRVAIGTLLAASATAAPAPDFELGYLSGNGEFSLNSARGKVVLIDFWATWCPPCKVSLPELSAIHEEFESRGFKVVAINIDQKASKARKFLERSPVSYEVLHDPEGSIAEAYDIPGMPSSFLIDRLGNVSFVHEGFKPGDEALIRQKIEALL